MITVTHSSKETEKLGKKIGRKLERGGVVLLFGEMGSGKSVFVRGLVNYFLPGKRVLSPTFIIVRHYQLSHFQIHNIYHLDLYRMTGLSDIENIALSELLKDKSNLVLIEWAEKLEGLKIKRRMELKFRVKGENEREIDIATYE